MRNGMEEGPCSPDEWNDRCAPRPYQSDEFCDRLDHDYPYLPHPMDAAQADQRSQMDRDDDLKRILSCVWTHACCNTPLGQGLTTNDFKILCQATGIDVRDVT